MVFVYNVEYYLNVRPVSEQSFSQVWSDLAQTTESNLRYSNTFCYNIVSGNVTPKYLYNHYHGSYNCSRGE